MIIALTAIESQGQVSFNDLLVISELEYAELVHGILVERSFDYKGRVEKDKDGYNVDTWSYSNGIAWIEYKNILRHDQETDKISEFHSIIFYTTSIRMYNSILNEIKGRGWIAEDKHLTGDNMEGFKSYLYFGEKTLYSKMKGILIGVNENFRGTTTYRFLFL
ncbi:MAG: hypothetical protein K2U26_19860 [Cyclobacteriaceae bacterium]|nr:hypothetical protein [Cyclobacteriaceae bacterium]